MAAEHGVKYDLRKIREICLNLGYPQVLTGITIDDRRDKDLTICHKVALVTGKLPKPRARAGQYAVSCQYVDGQP